MLAQRPFRITAQVSLRQTVRVKPVRDPWRLSRTERFKAWLHHLRRMPLDHPVLATLAIGIAVVAVVIAVLPGSGSSSASHDGWQSGALIGVKGEAPGMCASALGPDSSQLSGNQWIVCRTSGGYHCYVQPAHALNFKAQPIRRIAFDSDCRSALLVLRRAAILR